MEIILNFIEKYPSAGWVVVILIFCSVSYWILKLLNIFFPTIDILKSKIYMPLAKKFKFRRLVKGAIKSDIKGNVNNTVKKIQKELPNGWINEMDIKWVDNENKEDFIKDKRIVIRIRPLEDQALNFVTATYYFFKKALFPGTKRVIPEIPRETAVLKLCHRVIKENKKEYLKDFEDNILEDAIQEKDKILNYFDRYENIDKFGFFTGAFIREIHKIAYEIRHIPLRKIMPQEISEILEHIEYFIKEIPSVPEKYWKRLGPVTSYGFMLIGSRQKIKHQGAEVYIKRVKKDFNSGVKRLYLFGNASEKKFAKSFINGICKSIPESELIEIFELSYDYRGKRGGIGALLCLKNDGFK